MKIRLPLFFAAAAMSTGAFAESAPIVWNDFLKTDVAEGATVPANAETLNNPTFDVGFMSEAMSHVDYEQTLKRRLDGGFDCRVGNRRWQHFAENLWRNLL